MRVLEVYWSRALSLVCKVVLSSKVYSEDIIGHWFFRNINAIHAVFEVNVELCQDGKKYDNASPCVYNSIVKVLLQQCWSLFYLVHFQLGFWALGILQMRQFAQN